MNGNFIYTAVSVLVLLVVGGISIYMLGDESYRSSKENTAQVINSLQTSTTTINNEP